MLINNQKEHNKVEVTIVDFSTMTREEKNALKKAESYSNNMHMSKAKIYQQLTSEYGEKFTQEEAQYAIDHLED